MNNYNCAIETYLLRDNWDNCGTLTFLPAMQQRKEMWLKFEIPLNIIEKWETRCSRYIHRNIYLHTFGTTCFTNNIVIIKEYNKDDKVGKEIWFCDSFIIFTKVAASTIENYLQDLAQFGSCAFFWFGVKYIPARSLRSENKQLLCTIKTKYKHKGDLPQSVRSAK